MGIEFTPSVKSLKLESRQVRTLRVGFQLLAAYLFLQILFLAAQLLATPSEGVVADEPRPFDRRAAAIQTAVVFGLGAALAFPGAVLHLRAGRTARWRRAALGLIAVMLLQVAFAAGWLAAVDPARRPAEGQTLPARACEAGLNLMSVLEFWWLAVIVAEFGAACRATLLVRETEILGYVVLGAVLAVLALAAWSLPDAQTSVDEVAVALKVGLELAALVLVVWTVRLTLASSALARLVQAKIDEAGTQLAARGADESSAN
jgi:hypothetical protein